jgi:dienelactone hydrolase
VLVATETRSVGPTNEVLRTRIPTDGVVLDAALVLPADPRAVVIVARGGTTESERTIERGCRRFATRGFATMVLSLLGPDEVGDPRRTLDVFLLSRRLRAAADLVGRLPGTHALPIGYWAEGPGAAGALVASLDDPRVGAIVSRYGRPDLADGILDHVTAAALLLTDDRGMKTNRPAFERLRCPKQLTAVASPGERTAAGSHASAITHALDWLSRHLGVPPRARRPARHGPKPCTVQARVESPASPRPSCRSQGTLR